MPADLAERFHAFLTEMPHELGLGEEDAAAVLDRYYVPEIEYWNDGICLDRQRLIDHVKPARKNAVSVRIEVHESLVGEDVAAARYTLRAVMRKGKTITTEIYLFARYAHDGRIRRVDSITRMS
ncbi:nuclear transport factor 2 family protein [Nonomuraea turkmeniaca]|uniref:Nuclear transport factor 2 family protein n=1 Tax=Nonomuraea turkmeniaca TaxID=103838 RepID=A0A5S4FTS0_9ACTN|nr:nuclear transport factor 2 family protein [Nonomuraea turkmeniaca]TMR24155.1 nuclear transport factor 2 family protein [Nonomuraea turkmeniaca]